MNESNTGDFKQSPTSKPRLQPGPDFPLAAVIRSQASRPYRHVSFSNAAVCGLRRGAGGGGNSHCTPSCVLYQHAVVSCTQQRPGPVGELTNTDAYTYLSLARRLRTLSHASLSMYTHYFISLTFQASLSGTLHLKQTLEPFQRQCWGNF